MSTGALHRLIHRTDEQGPIARPCELCGQPIPDDHRHLLDLRQREPLCACYPCSVLFQRDEAGEGHYQLIPDRRVRLTGLSPADLGIPVGLAFFVKRSDRRIIAHYPSPAGATRWEIEPRMWESAVRGCTTLTTMAEEIEALLVNTASGRAEAWLVPIDDCYRLVAVVRSHWTGISGGERVWPRIEGFFEELRRCHGTDSNG